VLRVMLRPKWIAMLLLALAIAVVCVLLSQWQISRAIERGALHAEPEPVKQVQPLTALQEPQGPTRDAAAGSPVTVDGVFRADTDIVGGRYQGEQTGYWVVSRFDLETGASLAVARGFAATLEQARQVAAELPDQDESAGRASIAGVFFPTEAPITGDRLADGVIGSMSTAILVNRWQDVADRSFYSGYLIQQPAPTGLESVLIRHSEPDPVFDWLNVVYAIEWIVFAGFAVFVWYRMVRDEWIDEQEAAQAEPIG